MKKEIYNILFIFCIIIALFSISKNLKEKFNPHNPYDNSFLSLIDNKTVDDEIDDEISDESEDDIFDESEEKQIEEEILGETKPKVLIEEDLNKKLNEIYKKLSDSKIRNLLDQNIKEEYNNDIESIRKVASVVKSLIYPYVNTTIPKNLKIGYNSDKKVTTKDVNINNPAIFDMIEKRDSNNKTIVNLINRLSNNFNYAQQVHQFFKKFPYQKPSMPNEIFVVKFNNATIDRSKSWTIGLSDKIAGACRIGVIISSSWNSLGNKKSKNPGPWIPMGTYYGANFTRFSPIYRNLQACGNNHQGLSNLWWSLDVSFGWQAIIFIIYRGTYYGPIYPDRGDLGTCGSNVSKWMDFSLL